MAIIRCGLDIINAATYQEECSLYRDWHQLCLLRSWFHIGFSNDPASKIEQGHQARWWHLGPEAVPKRDNIGP